MFTKQSYSRSYTSSSTFPSSQEVAQQYQHKPQLKSDIKPALLNDDVILLCFRYDTYIDKTIDYCRVVLERQLSTIPLYVEMFDVQF